MISLRPPHIISMRGFFMKRKRKRIRFAGEEQGFDLFPFLFTASLVLLLTGVLLFLKLAGVFN